jgi:antibiotic biosynthesis monooxygenase (ABM) superfamily enzyme
MNIFIIKRFDVFEAEVTFVSMGTLVSTVIMVTMVTNIIFPDITSPHPFWLQRIVSLN